MLAPILAFASGIEFFRVPANVAAYLEPPEGEGANHVAPALTLIGLHSDQFSPHSFEASRDGGAAARHNQVAVGVEDLERNCIGEIVRVVTDLDGPRESVCLYPVSGGAKNEGLGHRAVSVVARVPPDPQGGSA